MFSHTAKFRSLVEEDQNVDVRLKEYDAANLQLKEEIEALNTDVSDFFFSMFCIITVAHVRAFLNGCLSLD